MDSLNGHLTEDLLSTSGHQTIRASIGIDVLEVEGDLECPDINGQDVDDFVYTDEDDLQVVLGRVQIEKDLVVKHLLMDNGTLNGVDVISLLNPPSSLFCFFFSSFSPFAEEEVTRAIVASAVAY